jgi:hypothetical protein
MARFGNNTKALEALTSGAVQVLGGTSWVWAEDFKDSVDVLFVDEAEQMSLANVVAVSRAARSLVLLGDPCRLGSRRWGVIPTASTRRRSSTFSGSTSRFRRSRGSFWQSPGGWRRARGFTRSVGHPTIEGGRDHLARTASTESGVAGVLHTPTSAH